MGTAPPCTARALHCTLNCTATQSNAKRGVHRSVVLIRWGYPFPCSRVCLLVCLPVWQILERIPPHLELHLLKYLNATQHATCDMQRATRRNAKLQRIACHLQHAPWHVHVTTAATRGKVRSTLPTPADVRCAVLYGATDATSRGAVPCKYTTSKLWLD